MFPKPSDSFPSSLPSFMFPANWWNISLGGTRSCGPWRMAQPLCVTLGPCARTIVTGDNTAWDPGAGESSLEGLSLTLLGAQGDGSSSESPTALSQTHHAVKPLSLHPCTSGPTPHPLQSTFGTLLGHLAGKDCGAEESFFFLWGEVQLFFCHTGKRKKNKPNTKNSVESHGIQTHSPQIPVCRTSLALKPQEPDNFCLWFQLPSLFPGLHLHTETLSHRETWPGLFTRGSCLLETRLARLSWPCPAWRWEQIPPHFPRDCSRLCPGVAELLGGLAVGCCRGERHWPEKGVFPGLKRGWHRAPQSRRGHPGLQS